MLSKIATILGMLAILGGFFTWTETHYALADEVNQIRQRLEFKIVEDKLDSVESRLFKLRSLPPSELYPTVKEDTMRLDMQQKRLQAQYEALLSDTK